MAINPRHKKPLTTLGVLVAMLIALVGGIWATTQWHDPRGQWTPKLGLDLEGGRQVVLEPVSETDQDVSSGQVDQAIDIIRNRIDGTGTAEAEVSRLGERNISVAIPGEPTQAQLDSLQRSSAMYFRPVLVSMPADGSQEMPGDPNNPENPTGEPTMPMPSQPQAPQPEETTGAPDDEATGTPEPTDGASDAPVPHALKATQSPSGEPTGGATEEPTGGATGQPGGGEGPTAQPENASSLEWVTPELQQELASLDCSKQTQEDLARQVDPKKPMVACDTDMPMKYLLGPVEVEGKDIANAESGPATNAQGQATGGVAVSLEFNDTGTKQFADVTGRITSLEPPRNQFAMVLDNQVISAPSSNAVIVDGRAEITGNFTAESGQLLADQLKFGALPLSFKVQTSEQISPTLGGEQLRLGLMAGVIGLLLVFVFAFLQYRALGIVVVASLLIAGALSYLLVVLLGTTQNFRLTMAGITGLIVSIGVTADSFIVYFERIRDEVRSGKPLRAAVETGWSRARQTIIISDVVNLLAAGALYFLSESNVKAFAFVLGLMTVVDLVMVIMFTHPIMTLLSTTKFFGSGHKWSGFDPTRLGAKKFTYAGRGKVIDHRARQVEEGVL